MDSALNSSFVFLSSSNVTVQKRESGLFSKQERGALLHRSSKDRPKELAEKQRENLRLEA